MAAPDKNALHLLVRCAALALVLVGVGAAVNRSVSYAQQPETAAPEHTARSPQEQAALVRDLIAGRLSPDVDPDSLFEGSVGGEQLLDTRLLLTLMQDRAALDRARRGESVPGIAPERVALAVARADFLRLSSQRRTAILAAQRARAASEAAPAAEAARKHEELNALTRRADGLQAFLNSEPADPETLSINLLDPMEAALQADRRVATLLAPDRAAAASEAAPNGEDVDARIAHARALIDTLRGRMLALSPDAFRQLVEAQRENGAAEAAAAEAEAAQAARLAAEAQAEAERATTETLRLLAQERSRFLSIRQAQAEFEAALSRRGRVSDDMSELTLRARREVREVHARSPISPGRDADADRLYDELVASLREVRGALSAALSTIAFPASELEPPELDPGLPDDEAATNELRAMRRELLSEAERLRERDASLRWDERTALYQAMTDINAIRLSLIPDLTANKRARVVGFGEAGIAQVGRELNQIVLTARYNLANAPQHLAETLRPLLNLTPKLIFTFLQLALLAIAFRFWRRNGEPVLTRAERSFAKRRPPTIVSATAATALGIYQEVRRPAEWLALVLLVRWALADSLTFVGDKIVWTVLIWLLVAALLVQSANGLVRTRSGEDPRAALRLKSLQLLAGAGAGVGLVLSLTSDLVGVGAIHHWVLSACWLLVPPMAFLLAEWWRERILTLAAAGAPKHAVLAWASRNDKGALGRVSGMVAGAFLLTQGLRTIVARRMNDIALIREIAGQRNRAKAAAQAAADMASGQYKPISGAHADALDPNRTPASPTPAARSPTARMLPSVALGKLTAVVGERGLGKSTALSDLLPQNAEGARVLRLQVLNRDCEPLIASMADQLGVANSLSEVGDALAHGPDTLVTVDDVQRLIVPTIGGLREFERLLALAQQVTAKTSWYFAIGDHAMTYLQRVRADRAMFDEVVVLPRWESAELRHLVERRTEQAALKPVFQQIDALGFGAADAELPPEERERRAYFERLTDYCEGNPALALEFWRRSLFENVATGETEVRTFSAPPVDEILTLPSTTVFILRTILQMEIADAKSIERATDLSSVVVLAATRRLERMGAVASTPHGYTVTLFWHREVVRVLQRQNLISRPFA